jgi:class 3 adenylate cyclase
VGEPTRRETAAVARFEQAASEVIAAHGGVRPVEQGEGDSFVAAFARASDAVACALELQRAPLAPISSHGNRAGCSPGRRPSRRREKPTNGVIDYSRQRAITHA